MPSGRIPVHGDHEGGQRGDAASAGAALDHSGDVGPELYNALRSQMTARAGREEEERTSCTSPWARRLLLSGLQPPSTSR